jgi:hypothetical protein
MALSCVVSPRRGTTPTDTPRGGTTPRPARLHEFEDLLGPWRDDAMAAREATATSVLESIGRPSGLRLDVTELVERWADVEPAVDGGRGVTLLRDGEPWATITRI